MWPSSTSIVYANGRIQIRIPQQIMLRTYLQTTVNALEQAKGDWKCLVRRIAVRRVRQGAAVFAIGAAVSWAVIYLIASIHYSESVSLAPFFIALAGLWEVFSGLALYIRPPTYHMIAINSTTWEQQFTKLPSLLNNVIRTGPCPVSRLVGGTRSKCTKQAGHDEDCTFSPEDSPPSMPQVKEMTAT